MAIKFFSSADGPPLPAVINLLSQSIVDEFALLKSPIQLTYATVGSATWNRPAGLKGIWVRCVGGGGGGGGRLAGAAQWTVGGGGGGGGYVEGFIPVSSLGASYTITVGAGGTSPAGGAAGNAGGASSFGSLAVAGGGGGGAIQNNIGNTTSVSAAGGTGGAATTVPAGGIGIPGMNGHDGRLNYVSSMGAGIVNGSAAGNGGHSHIGFGGTVILGATGLKSPGQNYGGGGTGILGGASISGPGDVGAQGLVTVVEFY